MQIVILYEWILMASQSLDQWIVEQDAGPDAWSVWHQQVLYCALEKPFVHTDQT